MLSFRQYIQDNMEDSSLVENADPELYVYHALTNGPFKGDKPSTDIGSDFDIMGKGFYFGDKDYASQYGEPKIFKVTGNLATREQWMKAIAKYSKKPMDQSRMAAREELKRQGFVGVLQGKVGVVWHQPALSMVDLPF